MSKRVRLRFAGEEDSLQVGYAVVYDDDREDSLLCVFFPVNAIFAHQFGMIFGDSWWRAGWTNGQADHDGQGA